MREAPPSWDGPGQRRLALGSSGSVVSASGSPATCLFLFWFFSDSTLDYLSLRLDFHPLGAETQSSFGYSPQSLHIGSSSHSNLSDTHSGPCKAGVPESASEMGQAW